VIVLVLGFLSFVLSIWDFCERKIGDGVRDGWWVQKEQGCSKNRTSDLSGTAFWVARFSPFSERAAAMHSLP